MPNALSFSRSFLVCTLSLTYHTQIPLETRAMLCLRFMGAGHTEQDWGTIETSSFFRIELAMLQGRGNRKENQNR